MVAKSYQKIGWTGEPFKENGKMYILLNNGKKARWYSVEEYKKLYPNDPIPEEDDIGSYDFRRGLGFGDRGFVYIFQGDTFPHKDELYEAKARYHNFWGWYIIEGIDCPHINGLNPIGPNYSFTRARSPSAQSLPTRRATEHQKACVGRHVARVPQHPP